MSSATLPAHERDHVDRATQHVPITVLGRWNQAIDHLRLGRIDVANRGFRDLSRSSLCPIGRMHVKLQAVRCLRDAPIDRLKSELALIEPQDDYQALVLDYRLGWFMRHRLASPEAAHQHLDRVQQGARRLGTRAWEIAALLQKGEILVSQSFYEQSIEHFTRVYNLSRRNSYVEYIPKALMHTGYTLVKLGQQQEGEAELQKAYELACRNELLPQQAAVLHMMARVCHREFGHFGLALEYYRQARAILHKIPTWPSALASLEEDAAACQRALSTLDLAKVLGPRCVKELRRDYLRGLVESFVGIPGFTKEQIAKAAGITRQTLHRLTTE